MMVSACYLMCVKKRKRKRNDRACLLSIPCLNDSAMLFDKQLGNVKSKTCIPVMFGARSIPAIKLLKGAGQRFLRKSLPGVFSLHLHSILFNLYTPCDRTMREGETGAYFNLT